MSTTRTLTILFAPESAYGPTNQCIGLGAVLRRRGHRIVFAAESSWRGRLEPLGFEEALVDLAPPAGTEQDAGAFWTDFVRETAPEFRRPTRAQLQTFMQPTWQALIDGATYCERRLGEIVGDVRPDVVVEDNVVCFPALVTSDAPFVRVVSCNPLEIHGPGIPPPYSGLPAGDPSGWDDFRAEYDRTHRQTWSVFNDWVLSQGAPALPDLQFVHASGHANLYVYPAEADYARPRPLDATWHRMDSSVRTTDEAYELPEVVRERPDDSALVYLSLGSLGGADIDLMRQLVDAMGGSRHRFVVSMGPRADELELAENMVGAAVLPQTTVLPQVDVVITHGGNNTTTEALHFGKPMIVLPLFWDQHDNAQRVDELGFGVRLPTYEATAEQLNDTLDRLVADAPRRAAMAALGERIRARDGLRRGADVIEQVARSYADGRPG